MLRMHEGLWTSRMPVLKEELVSSGLIALKGNAPYIVSIICIPDSRVESIEARLICILRFGENVKPGKIVKHEIHEVFFILGRSRLDV